MATNYVNLFANKSPKATAKSPQYVCLWDKETKATKKLNIDGQEYDICAWVKETKTGEKYLSIGITKWQPEIKKIELPDKRQADLPF